MLPRGAKAKLFLNDECVGDVTAVSGHTGWGFGTFLPNPAFARYAVVFGRWSLLLHAAGETARLDEASHEELRLAERDMDSIRARLWDERRRQWHAVGQLNIDGDLIEWKEY